MIRPDMAVTLSLVTLICLIAASSSAEEIQRRADAPKPLPPEASLRHFNHPDDVRIEIVASEPLLADPTAIAWDEQGRLFVAEIHGYNLEGHLDVEELNKTGQLDEVVRRISANSAAQEAAEKDTYGTVRMLTDTDGDGRMDRSTVWADRLPPCHGIVAARGGIIAVGRPDIIFLADRDNDGRAEVRETLFTGFEITILERSMNNPRWGVDNWIYVSAGREGGEITGPHLKNMVSIGASDFRFKPDGSAIEQATGRNYMFGQTMNDWGDRFVTPPGLYAIPIAQRYLSRNPYFPTPSVNVNAASSNRLYPTSQPHPWRVERSERKEWNKYYSDRYGSSEAAPNGFFTAACGQMIYRADRLSPQYRGNHFCCDPAQNLVHRSLLRRNGLRFEVSRAASEQQSEFLSSTDQWFRPTNLSTGPDGAIYIVDMYREIIEDYSAIPRYLQQQYGLIEGKNHGRIWRIVPKDMPALPKENLADATIPRLVAELSNANAWQRLTAQRLLVERADPSSYPLLKDLAKHGKTPQGRLHALYTLSGLTALEPADAKVALSDAHYAVRFHALKISEHWFQQHPLIFEAALKLINDPDPRVRLQLALSLGEIFNESSIQALAKLAASDGEDSLIRAAILSAVPSTSNDLLEAIAGQLIEQSGDVLSAEKLLHPLAAIIGARHHDVEISRLLFTIASTLKNHTKQQTTCLTGLLEGLDRGQSRALDSIKGKESLSHLLTGKSVEVRQLALRVASATKFTESKEMQTVFSKATADALDNSQKLEARIAAIEILASTSGTTLNIVAEQLLDSRQPSTIQLAAIEVLATKRDIDITPVLLSNWDGSTPAVRQAVIDAFFGHVGRLPALLNAIGNDRISPQALSGFQRFQLLEHPDKELRSRAQKILANTQQLLNPELAQKYQGALENRRDASHGKLIFDKNCASCHKVNSQEKLVGPDLSVILTRTDESVLLDILQPNAKITAGYRSYVVIDNSGRLYSGILASESETSITLRSLSTTKENRKSEVIEQTLLRKDIDVLQGTEQSLMPENLDKLISPQDVADLLAYIRTSLGPVPSTRITLFDDDAKFLNLLSQGTGRATLERLDTFSGSSALRISPPQRYSPSIPGWNYPIRENPGPGEFRYLRFAWKSPDSVGIMLELADQGDWPPANSPMRRYYSGLNTTSWQATTVSSEKPVEWTLVTRDLWKDYGDFTLTGIAPTAMGGSALFDRIELHRSLENTQ